MPAPAGQSLPRCRRPMTQGIGQKQTAAVGNILLGSLRLLQEHLGHASFNTTARYRKIAGTEHRVWYDHLWDNND
ncbi:hypothetical protein ACFLTP_05530 [Chloroflexota bacterium]